jgi:hypothetical protein
MSSKLMPGIVMVWQKNRKSSVDMIPGKLRGENLTTNKLVLARPPWRFILDLNSEMLNIFIPYVVSFIYK